MTVTTDPAGLIAMRLTRGNAYLAKAGLIKQELGITHASLVGDEDDELFISRPELLLGVFERVAGMSYAEWIELAQLITPAKGSRFGHYYEALLGVFGDDELANFNHMTLLAAAGMLVFIETCTRIEYA